MIKRGTSSKSSSSHREVITSNTQTARRLADYTGAEASSHPLTGHGVLSSTPGNIITLV